MDFHSFFRYPDSQIIPAHTAAMKEAIMYQYQVDLSTFVDIPSVRSYFDHPHVLISGKGNISLNSSMQKKVGEQREFHARISPDGRYLALYPEETANLRFSKKGATLLHVDLLKLLESKGIQFPTAYEMEWHTEDKVWVGCCPDLPAPPASAAKGKGSAARSGK